MHIPLRIANGEECENEPAVAFAVRLNLQPRVSKTREVTELRCLARVRQKIFFKQICERWGRKNRLAVLNKITAMSDAPKMF